LDIAFSIYLESTLLTWTIATQARRIVGLNLVKSYVLAKLVVYFQRMLLAEV
jgi:hypothetical protein